MGKLKETLRLHYELGLTPPLSGRSDSGSSAFERCRTEIAQRSAPPDASALPDQPQDEQQQHRSHDGRTEPPPVRPSPAYVPECGHDEYAQKGPHEIPA